MRNDEIIIKKWSITDYKDMARYGLRFFTGFQHLKFLFNQENYSLVAYSLSEKRAVGIVYLQRINDNIWGIWSTFVVPDFRGRGIASDLYKKSFELLREQGVKKVIGSASAGNIPSVGNIKKIWDGFLDKAIFKLRVPRSLDAFKNILVERLDSENINDCYDIFLKHVGTEWIEYLEINKGNFMERVFGSAGCEAYSRSISRRLFFQSEVLTAKQDNRLLGYCVFARSPIFNKVTRTDVLGLPHFFSRDINELRICSSPLLRQTGFNAYYWIGDVSEEKETVKTGFEMIDKELVCYKNL